MRIYSFFLIFGLFGLILLIGNPIKGAWASNAAPSNTNSSLQSNDFYMNITAPQYVDPGGTFEVAVEVWLMANRTASNITLIISFAEASNLSLASNETATHDLEDFSFNETQIDDYFIVASTSIYYMTGQVRLYENGEEQRVQTDDPFQPGFGTFAVSLKRPEMKIKGPLELKGQVVPRLKLSPDEKGTLTFNITNEGEGPVFNLIFSVSAPTTFEILSISQTSRATLEPHGSTLVKIEGKCTANSASSNKLHFYVNSDNHDPVQKTIRIESFDWYNPMKFDNSISVIAWPITIAFFIILAVVMTVYYWKKRNERIRKQKELEELYGKALDIVY
ncbi:MAG: hypothetical protein ACFFGZ_08625 [Candidatus Thorarchaeota archaeon]